MDILEKIDKLILETTFVSGIVGSGQTRAVGGYDQTIKIMQQKEPDNKKAVKFSSLLGAFVPSEWESDVIDPEEQKGDLE